MLPRPGLTLPVICTQHGAPLPGGDVVMVPDGGVLDTYPIVRLARGGGGETQKEKENGKEGKNLRKQILHLKSIQL